MKLYCEPIILLCTATKKNGYWFIPFVYVASWSFSVKNHDRIWIRPSLSSRWNVLYSTLVKSMAILFSSILLKGGDVRIVQLHCVGLNAFNTINFKTCLNNRLDYTKYFFLILYVKLFGQRKIVSVITLNSSKRETDNNVDLPLPYRIKCIYFDHNYFISFSVVGMLWGYC